MLCTARTEVGCIDNKVPVLNLITTYDIIWIEAYFFYESYRLFFGMVSAIHCIRGCREKRLNSGDKAFKIVLIDISNYYKYNGNMGRIQLLRKKFKIKNGEGVKYMYYVGKKIHLQTSLDVAHEYKNLSEKDLDAANLLMINGLYNEAYYYFIQSMEKNIKKRICEIIDITNPFFSNQMKDIGHSLDNAIEFLLRLISGNNKIMYEQIRNQIVEGVLKGIKFSSVHNNVRYPYYNPNKKEYVCLVITSEDCYEIQQMEKKLKVFLNELHRL